MQSNSSTNNNVMEKGSSNTDNDMRPNSSNGIDERPISSNNNNTRLINSSNNSNHTSVSPNGSENINERPKSSDNIDERPNSSDNIDERLNNLDYIDNRQNSSADDIDDRPNSSDSIDDRPNSSENIDERPNSSDDIDGRPNSLENIDVTPTPSNNDETQKSSNNIETRSNRPSNMGSRSNSSNSIGVRSINGSNTNVRLKNPNDKKPNRSNIIDVKSNNSKNTVTSPNDSNNLDARSIRSSSNNSNRAQLSELERSQTDVTSIASRSTSEKEENARYRQNVLRRELTKMKEREENEKLRKQAKRKEMEREAKKKLGIERLDRGFTIVSGAMESKNEIRRDIQLEERIALKEKQDKLRSDSKEIQDRIDVKFGISDLPKGEQLVAFAQEFYSSQHMPNDHLPDHVTKVLTTEEIGDFRAVFDLFDVKNKGYITSADLKRVTGMLGLTAKKRVFKEMIDYISTNKRGRVNFVSFLELVIKIQGDGPDPVDEMKKGFSMLDKGDKGFLTFSDLQSASEELEVSLSNKAIREMISEADMTGDGTISLEEFQNILMHTSTFKSMTSS